jgi:hypothetical protein
MTIDIDAIRQRLAATSIGPWQAYPDGLVWPPRLGDPVSASTELADAEFIAHARQDIPALLAEIERLNQQAEIRERSLRAVNTGLAKQRADLADKLHKANAEIASLTKAGTAWANETAELKASVKRLIEFRNVKVWEADELAQRLKAVRAIAARADRADSAWVSVGDLLRALGGPHPAESRPAFVATEAEVA